MNSKLTLSSLAAAVLLSTSTASSAAASVLVHTSSMHPDFNTIMSGIDKAKKDIRDAGAKIAAYREEVEADGAGTDSDVYQAEHFTTLGEFLLKAGAVDADSYTTMLAAFRSGGKSAAASQIEKAAKILYAGLIDLEKKVATCSEQTGTVNLGQIIGANMAGNPALAIAQVMVAQASFTDLVTAATLIVVEDNYTQDGNGSLTAVDIATGGNAGLSTTDAGLATA